MLVYAYVCRLLLSNHSTDKNKLWDVSIIWHEHEHEYTVKPFSAADKNDKTLSDLWQFCPAPNVYQYKWSVDMSSWEEVVPALPEGAIGVYLFELCAFCLLKYVHTTSYACEKSIMGLSSSFSILWTTLESTDYGTGIDIVDFYSALKQSAHAKWHDDARIREPLKLYDPSMIRNAKVVPNVSWSVLHVLHVAKRTQTDKQTDRWTHTETLAQKHRNPDTQAILLTRLRSGTCEIQPYFRWCIWNLTISWLSKHMYTNKPRHSQAFARFRRGCWAVGLQVSPGGPWRGLHGS